MNDEQLIKELREMECPFDASDPRTRVWLDGYQAGHKRAFVSAIASFGRIIDEEMGRPIQ